jgi:hypothetical protein
VLYAYAGSYLLFATLLGHSAQVLHAPPRLLPALSAVCLVGGWQGGGQGVPR